MTVHLVLLQQELHAFAHALSYISRPRDHAVKVCFWCAHFDAVVLGVVDVFKHVGAFQQGFGGNTTPIQADATE